MEKLPWHKWYASRWLSSRSRLTMSPLERSIYRDLLDHIYVDGNIPNDKKILAILAAVSLEELEDAWPVVGKRFVACEDDPTSLTNTNVEDELRRRGEKAEAGRLGGYAKAGKRPSKALAPARQIEREKKTESESLEEEKEPEPTSAPQRGACVCDSSFSSKTKTPFSEGKQKPSVQQEAWFTDFWDAYWLKKSRKRASDVFVSKVRSQEMFDCVMESIMSQSAEMLSREPQRRPYAETWLAEERWTDEPAQSAKPPAIPRAW